MRRALPILLFAVSLTGCGLVGTGAQTGRTAHPVYHVLQPGETLYQLEQRYKVPHEQIAMLNGIRDPESITAGRRLLIRYDDGAVNSRNRGSVTSERSQRIERANYAPPRAERIENISPRGGVIGWPLKTGEIVSPFGPRRGSFHDGLDIAAPSGTKIYAAQDGVVFYSGNGLSGYGNLVIVRDAKGMTTIYAHCRRRSVKEGQRVKRGQLVAEVGATGHASGPHLHFEVRTKDARGHYVAVDPLPLLTQSSRRPRYRINESLTPILSRLNPFNWN